MQILKVFQRQKIIESKTLMSLIRTNNKKYVTCCYGNKSECIDDKFNKPFKSCLGEDAIYNCFNNMIEESRYCIDVIKKRFNRELVMT